jgi:hypothetical protein
MHTIYTHHKCSLIQGRAQHPELPVSKPYTACIGTELIRIQFPYSILQITQL